MTITFYEATADGVPGCQIEIKLNAAGGLVNANDYRNTSIMAERVAAGTSAANEVASVPFASESDAIAWFGANSPGAMMASYIYNHREPEIKKAKCDIYGIAIAESAGVARICLQTFVTSASAAGDWIFEVGQRIPPVARVPADLLYPGSRGWCGYLDRHGQGLAPQ
jgi:hypothetical protein